MELDPLIHEATLITMDLPRRVLRHASIGIAQGRIGVICPADAAQGFSAHKTLDGSGRLIFPGFIDTHAHAGHGLTKTLSRFILRIGDTDGARRNSPACGGLKQTDALFPSASPMPGA